VTLSPAELAALPTAPTVSGALNDAARYVQDGPIGALSKAVYGSANSTDYAVFTTPEHTIAWGVGLVCVARRIDPAVSSEWPDASWGAERFATTVGEAHRTLTDWAEGHTAAELAELFRTTAHEVRATEQ
jgi:hypothetical protein